MSKSKKQIEIENVLIGHIYSFIKKQKELLNKDIDTEEE
tara:strand:- start:392 stop:508 length:117 start_codon:yes stop_codon:yes gene_type:complete